MLNPNWLHFSPVCIIEAVIVGQGREMVIGRAVNSGVPVYYMSNDVDQYPQMVDIGTAQRLMATARGAQA